MNRANSSYNYGFHDVRLSKEKRVETKVKVWSFVLKLLLAWGKNAKRHFHKTAAKSRYAVKILEKPFFISSATTIKVTILTKLGDFCKYNFLIILCWGFSIMNVWLCRYIIFKWLLIWDKDFCWNFFVSVID